MTLLFDAVMTTIFMKMSPYLAPLTFALSVLMFADKLVVLFYSATGLRK
ncbi:MULTISPECIES: hypothetical protein [Bacillus cereus group]|jgi:hypothetical protein|nr:MULTISPECIES: hypothetical protein [Bacillus cereus group]MDA2480643.1 hypothetical protein [Bacillus cereus]MDA2497699.1 hypothetical protein [Bacillus cereus]NIL33884.1 hypothetical protein [Bacillus thuringiensis]